MTDVTARRTAEEWLDTEASPMMGVGWALLDLADAVREFVDMPRPELRGFLETPWGPATVSGVKAEEFRQRTVDGGVQRGEPEPRSRVPVVAVGDVEAQLDAWVVEGDGSTVVMLGTLVAQLRTLIRAEGAELAPLSVIEATP